MSLFTDLLSGSDGVYSLTNRPDLVAESKLAIRQETLAAHRCEKWKKDKKEIYLPLASASLFSIDIPTYFPNYRQMEWIRPYDSVAQSPAGFVLTGDQELAPDAIFDEYANEKTNVWYVAGDNLNIKLSAAWDSFLVGYYANPVLLPEANYESWIAREQPAVIVLGATIRVLDMIGYNDAARRLDSLLVGSPDHGNNPSRANPTGGEYMLLKQSYLESFGR